MLLNLAPLLLFGLFASAMARLLFPAGTAWATSAAVWAALFVAIAIDAARSPSRSSSARPDHRDTLVVLGLLAAVAAALAVAAHHRL